jgi:hypothetical protein
MVAPIVAAKALQNATAGLKGDVFVQKWVKDIGTKKEPKIVEREFHLNPLQLMGGLAIGAVAVGAGGLLALLALRKQVSFDAGVKRTRFMRLYDAEYKTVVETVVDSSAHTVDAQGHWEATGTGTVQGRGYSAGALVWVVDVPAYVAPAVTHEVSRQVLVKAGKAVIYTDRFIPIRWQNGVELVDKVHFLSEHEKTQGWIYGLEFDKAGEDRLGKYAQYRVPMTNATKKAAHLIDRGGNAFVKIDLFG